MGFLTTRSVVTQDAVAAEALRDLPLVEDVKPSLFGRLSEALDRSMLDRETRRMAAHMAWTDRQRARFGVSTDD